MKAFAAIMALFGVLLLTGCQHFEYRIVQPAQAAQRVGKEPVIVREPPLDYSFTTQRDHLSIQIQNPTDGPIALLANKSYVVDPRGESHPINGRVIAPHSHTAMVLPPPPLTVNAYGYMPYYAASPFWYPYPWHPGLQFGFYYDWPMYEPYSYSYQVRTPYNWEWKTGEVRLHLGYDQAGKPFEHNFVFVREPIK